MDNLPIIPSPANKGRKKLPDKANWKREKAKIKRYSAKNLPLYPSCAHDDEMVPFQCTNKAIISLAAIRDFHRKLYTVKNKIEQDKFLLTYCKASAPKRKKKFNISNKAKDMSVKYYIRTEIGDLAQICRESFSRILGIGKDRILNVLKRHRATGDLPKENRGGDKIKGKNDLKRTTVMKFIESLTCTESHYSRSKNVFRKYLPCELNISKLWRMSNAGLENEDLKVKLCFFRKIFTRNYNIGFGSLQSDVCSTCIQFTEKMKVVNSPEAKVELMTYQRVHKLRAKCFYDLLKQNNEDVQLFSFDCEKNLPLPKLPDQACYFSMQLNLYNFKIVSGPSSTSLNRKTVNSFIWTEVDGPRSSNEIASAVFYKLKNFSFKESVKSVKLVADGCAAQNKNSIMVGMCMHWLDKYAPPYIQEVQFIFPVVGHSFIPPDRVFGNIERVVKKTPNIISPNEYIEIIKQFSTVYEMGKDYQVLDFKKEVSSILKLPTTWHFQISKVKRILITKTNSENNIVVRGESHHRNDLEQTKSVLKRGKKLSQFNPQELAQNRTVKPDKIKSISDLLKKHYGEKWMEEESLGYFKRSFSEGNHNEEIEEEIDQVTESDMSGNEEDNSTRF